MFGIHDMPDFGMYCSLDKMLQMDAVAEVMTKALFTSYNQHMNDNTQQA